MSSYVNHAKDEKKRCNVTQSFGLRLIKFKYYFLKIIQCDPPIWFRIKGLRIVIRTSPQSDWCQTSGSATEIETQLNPFQHDDFLPTRSWH